MNIKTIMCPPSEFDCKYTQWKKEIDFDDHRDGTWVIIKDIVHDGDVHHISWVEEYD